MNDKKKPPPTPRSVDVRGLPAKFDCADLIAQGLSEEEYLKWIMDHLIPGPPVWHVEPAEIKQPPKPKPEPKPEPKPVANPTPEPIDNVTALRKPDPDEEPLPVPPEFSEDGLAEKFTDRYHETMKFCGAAEKWYVWDEDRWQQDGTNLAVDKARKIVKKASGDVMMRLELANKRERISAAICTRRVMSNIEQIARTDRRHVVKPTQFDSNPWILNTPGGVVDLKTGELRPARKEDYCTNFTAVTPGGECPRWLSFLEDATNGDPELMVYLQRIAGYCLTASVAEHAFFFCYGTGGNGKGTYVNTIDFLMGSYSKVSNMDTFTEQRFSKHSSELAFFQGARLVTAQETEEGKRWNEARIKTLTGGDPITARFMYQSEFTYYPTFKLLFSGNHKPQLRNVDEAIKRRLYLIPFEHEVPPEKRDTKLGDYLRKKEGPGILQWAIEGCLDWRVNTLNAPERVKATTAEYFDGEDRIGAFFTECCETGTGYREITSRLYQRYREWAEESGEYAVSRKRFLDALGRKGYRSRNHGGQMSVGGIKLPDAY